MSESGLERHNRRSIESRWSHDDCMNWAESVYAETRRWPVRRYRVEGTPAGNSSLMPEPQARRTQRKYGGRVVEVIPSRKAFISRGQNSAATDGQ
jgi:hypothetical protein